MNNAMNSGSNGGTGGRFQNNKVCDTMEIITIADLSFTMDLVQAYDTMAIYIVIMRFSRK